MTTGYGVDIWCTDALAPGKLVRGSLLVAQALYGRLITPRGTLVGGDEESAYGLDVGGYVGSVGTAVALRALPGLVRGEIKKDDRVADVIVVATIATNAAGEVEITLEIDVVLEDAATNFALTVAIANATATLVGTTA